MQRGSRRRGCAPRARPGTAVPSPCVGPPTALNLWAVGPTGATPFLHRPPAIPESCPIVGLPRWLRAKPRRSVEEARHTAREC